MLSCFHSTLDTPGRRPVVQEHRLESHFDQPKSGKRGEQKPGGLFRFGGTWMVLVMCFVVVERRTAYAFVRFRWGTVSGRDIALGRTGSLHG